MTAEQIKSAVCESFKIEECDFIIVTRSIKHAYPRFAYFVLCQQFTDLTVTEISKTVLQAHTTVLYGIKKHEDLMFCDLDYRIAFARAKKLVQKLSCPCNQKQLNFP